MNSRLGSRLLALAGWWNIAFAVLHLVILFMGGRGYRYFGAGEQMARAAEAGDSKPALITSGLTVMFVLFGLYALAAAGHIRRLPLTRWLVLAIGILYVLRGILAGPQAVWAWQRPELVPLRFVLFSGVALVLGVITVYGVRLRWQDLGARPAEVAQHA
jgi:hypothetical protein